MFRVLSEPNSKRLFFGLSCASAGGTDAQTMQMAKGLAVTGDLQAAADQIKGLYKLFDSCDCTMVEVSHGMFVVRRTWFMSCTASHQNMHLGAVQAL